MFEYIEKPEKIKRLKVACFLLLALIFLADFPIPRDHVHFWWDGIPGFDAVYGFFACVLIIVVSKTLGHLGIMQNEDYYQEDDNGD
ncbi:MAG: hypothetical protein GY866_10120 [Proteobacteria bacterium]|nr:hypothetical protein [Pseudomonadota bacterium]